MLVTNADPSLSCGYPKLDADYDYTFPSADETVLMRLHGRDYVAAFRPTERRGVVWSTRLLIYSKGNTDDIERLPPSGAGVQAFATLRAIAETQASIAVLTGDGERLYASVQVPSGPRLEPAHHYAADVVFTQVSDTPTVVEV
jgi:hypothetical protein